MTAISAPCDRKYDAAFHGGLRLTSTIRWIVIHDTEGSTAEGAAAWFENPKAKGSAHLVVDNEHCFRTLENDVIAYAAPPCNAKGFQIEIAGFAAWTRVEWLRHKNAIERAAYKAAIHADAWKIPVRQIGVPGLLLQRKGICGHRAVSRAFHKSDHSDPGVHFPWDVFMEYARGYSSQV